MSIADRKHKQTIFFFGEGAKIIFVNITKVFEV